jgi:hypothetical protein
MAPLEQLIKDFDESTAAPARKMPKAFMAKIPTSWSDHCYFQSVVFERSK